MVKIGYESKLYNSSLLSNFENSNYLTSFPKRLFNDTQWKYFFDKVTMAVSEKAHISSILTPKHSM